MLRISQAKKSKYYLESSEKGKVSCLAKKIFILAEVGSRNVDQVARYYIPEHNIVHITQVDFQLNTRC